MNDRRSIGEQELHAYVDGALSEDLRRDVEDWLSNNPDDRSKVDRWLAQNRSMHALFDGVLDERLPDQLVGRLATVRPPVRTGWWRQAAAAVVLVAVGFAGGWSVHYLPIVDDSPQTDFVRQAVGAHLVFSGENRHAVEVRADNEERHLVRWLSKRLGHPIQPPPLNQAGFTLIGGRLVADRGGPAAQFMYQDAAKRRITLYVRRGDDGTNTAFRFITEDGVAAFYWMDRPLSYAVIARMEREELLRLARVVYEALGHPDPTSSPGS